MDLTHQSEVEARRINSTQLWTVFFNIQSGMAFQRLLKGVSAEVYTLPTFILGL